MKRLSPGTMPRNALHPDDRAEQHGVGIVHFGLGAFTRAHQAWYTDRAMALAGGDWRIMGVSLRSAQVADQLNPQGGRYTLVEKSGGGEQLRIIASVAGVIVAPLDPEAVVDRLMAPSTHVVTFTITEKGYCRAADGSLDPDLADGASIYRFLHEGWRAARQRALPG